MKVKGSRLILAMEQQPSSDKQTLRQARL